MFLASLLITFCILFVEGKESLTCTEICVRVLALILAGSLGSPASFTTRYVTIARENCQEIGSTEQRSVPGLWDVSEKGDENRADEGNSKTLRVEISFEKRITKRRREK